MRQRHGGCSVAALAITTSRGSIPSRDCDRGALPGICLTCAMYMLRSPMANVNRTVPTDID